MVSIFEAGDSCWARQAASGFAIDHRAALGDAGNNSVGSLVRVESAPRRGQARGRAG